MLAVVCGLQQDTVDTIEKMEEGCEEEGKVLKMAVCVSVTEVAVSPCVSWTVWL